MQSSCSGPPISSHDYGRRLFSDKFVRQRSVPASGGPGADTYPFIETKNRPQATSSINRTCTSQIVSRQSPGCITKQGSSATTLSNGKQCKRPSTIANSSGSSRARPNVSQLRQQSLPTSLTKSKSSKLSTSNTTSTAGSQQNGSSLHKAAAARQNQKLMSGPSLTSLHLARRDQQKWQQSIPSKSSPKQPLLDKRLGITSQKCARERNSAAHQRKFSHGGSSLHSHGAHRSSSASEKTACGGSEIEITQVQFDLDKLPKVESGLRKSSISTLGSGSAEFEEVGLFPDSNYRCRKCRDATKLQPKLKRRSIEIHLPMTTASLSAADGAKKSKCIPPAPSTERHEEKRCRCSKSEERQTRSRRSLNHNHRACGVRREVSRIRKTSSLSTASDDGDRSFDYGDSEVDSLSSDLEKSLSLQQEGSESDCITNDTSFTEYDYPINERGLSDEEGEGATCTGWDGECILFEEELTDLDTDTDDDDDNNDDLLMSEQDVEDSTSAEDNFSATSKHMQPLKTCVQQELTPHHHCDRQQQQFNKAFLQVNGAGLTAPEREMSNNSVITGEQHRHHGAASTSSNNDIGHGVDAATENGLADLIAEVERRRLRDFGRDPTLDHQIVEGSCNVPSKREGSPGADMQRERSKSVPCATKERLSRYKVSFDQKPGTPAVKTCGEASASDVGVGGSLGVSTPRGSDQPSPALTPSLFPGCLPPTIHFPMPDENYVPLSKEQRALLKWKMSSITPNVVKNCIARAGFTKCTRGSAWLGYWGKHMKAPSFRNIKEHQKVNHFPGTFQIGRKDRLWRNLSRLQARVGRRDCDFVPQTFVLPQDTRKLKKQFEEGGTKQKWILKPPAAARGIGIRLAHKWSQIPKKKPVIVQRYLADPFLINGSKFDLRVYVYVSSYDPLIIYVFREGLTRFATCKYSSAMKNLSNRFMHLTNYSINKQNSEFTPNTDETVCQGHKWGLLALWRYMRTHLGVDTERVWDSIKDLIIKTIISSEPYVSSYVKAFVRNRHSVHELFGFDIMLDRQLKPWVLEVNISPSLHSNSQLDVNIKGRMVRDLFNITGFYLPTRQQIAGEEPFIHHTMSLSPEERIKHSHFVQRSMPKTERKRILDSLTPDDIRMLMLFEDELSRCGHFERVYPLANFDRYRKFFEIEKYYNILLGEWAAKYEKCPRKGVLLLQRLAFQSGVSCNPG